MSNKGTHVAERPAARPDLLVADIEGERVVWDPVRRHIHRLNAPAAAIWDRCDGRQTPDEIASDLARRFGTDPVTVRTDVQALLTELESEYLLDDGQRVVPVLEPSVPMPKRGPVAATARRMVQEHTWPATHGPYRAFDFSFDVCTDDVELGSFLSETLTGLAADVPEPMPHRYAFRVSPSSGRTVLSLDGTALMRSLQPARVVDYFFWHLNRMALRSSPERLLVHAAAAVVGGRTTVMPANSGSGKSTLVTGLALAGAQYLSDECIGLDPATGTAWPYSKPVTVDRGSWHLFAALEPADDVARMLSDHQWQVGPGRLPGGIGSGAPPDLLIFPQYRAGQPTEATPLEPIEALAEVLRHTFTFDALGQTGIEALVSLVTRIPAHRLDVGDLVSAVALVTDLAEGSRAAH